jgi:hypothetical protein
MLCRPHGNRRLFSWDTGYLNIFGDFKSSAFEEVFAEVEIMRTMVILFLGHQRSPQNGWVLTRSGGREGF